MANAPNPWPFDFDRDRGIFTPRDRRFLAGELDEELTENSKRQKRYRLRRRLAHAIEDLVYLEEMDIRDLGQVATGIEEGITADVIPWEEPLPPDIHRRLERITTGATGIAGFYGSVLGTEIFADILTEQLEIQAALNHYEETGKAGLFTVTVNVELDEELTLDELAERYDGASSHHQPGVYQLLDRYGPPDWKAWEATLPVRDPPVDGELRERVALVADAYTAVNDGESYPARAEVAETLATKEEISRGDAEKLIDEALYAGVCYEPEEGKLNWI